MSITLNDEDTRLTTKMAEWYIRDGIPDDRIRAVALDGAHDDELEQVKRLRSRLREAATEKVVIGRHAYDLLRSIEWDDAETAAAVESARESRTRVTVRSGKGPAASFAGVLAAASDSAMADGSPLNARRYRVASAQFAEAMQ